MTIGEVFVFMCQSCGEDRTIKRGIRRDNGLPGSFVMNDCHCPDDGTACPQCGEAGRHLLDCPSLARVKGGS